jgi:hypothetical protein
MTSLVDDNDRLALVLASVGDHLVIECDVIEREEPAGGYQVPARPSTVPRRSRRWRAGPILAAAAVIVAAVLGFAPTRGALAGWLGIGSTRIRLDPVEVADPTLHPSIADDAEPVGRASAEELLGRPLPDLDASQLGAPAGYAAIAEGGVLVVWDDATTLWIHQAQIDLGAMREKQLPATSPPEPVEDLGDEALLLRGDHLLKTPHRSMAATTVVLWLSGPWELRLESDRPEAELIDIARQIDQGL